MTRNCHRVFRANSIPFFDMLLAKKLAFLRANRPVPAGPVTMGSENLTR